VSPLSAVTASRSKAGCPHSHRLTHPITNAVAVGLAIGKPLGIIVVSAIVVRLGWGNLPEGVSWLMLAGASSLAGIGFTMSLFTAGLAFEADYLLPAKSGVLVASLARALLGVLILKLATTRAMTSLTRADD
jgi:Na+:H+ antiporter, NhaA family